MKILILDDSKTMLRIISNTIKRIGITDITTAEDGIQGLYEYHKAIKENKPFSIIFSDWNMPNMNGLEFVIEIRKINKDIPIVMITTEGGKIEVIRALKAGVNSYIIKPFTPTVLKDKLNVVLGLD